MGDRAYCQVEVAACIREQVEKIFDNHGFTLLDEEATDDHTVIFEDSEANYGGSSLTDELEKEKIPYFGYHDAGGCYGPALFAFDGTEGYQCTGAEGQPLCSVGDDGEPIAASLQGARDYLRVKASVLATIKAAALVAEVQQQ